LLLPVALGLSASRSTTRLRRTPGAPRASRGRPTFQAAPIGRTAPLLASTGGGEATVIEGAGRFVGEPPTGSTSAGQDNVADDNLVYVPASRPQHPNFGNTGGRLSGVRSPILWQHDLMSRTLQHARLDRLRVCGKTTALE
jgi:hypothetical protein